MPDHPVATRIRAIARALARNPDPAELPNVALILADISREVRSTLLSSARWQSLAPTLRKLVDEPEEFDDILQLILTGALIEIDGLEEGSIYGVDALQEPKQLLQLRKLIRGVGSSVGIATADSRYPRFTAGDGSSASLALETAQAEYVDECSTDGRYLPYTSGDQLASLACIPIT